MQRRIFAAVSAVALSLTASSFAVEHSGGDLKVLRYAQIGDVFSGGPEVVDPAALYSNVTTFGSAGVRNLGATSTVPVTNLLADDVTTAGAGLVGSYKFSVANFNSTATTARMRVRYYDSTGAGGGPGALISAISFNPSVINPGVTTFNTGPLTAALQFAVPNGQIWAGVFFDNVGATATTFTELNNLGLGVFNPPDVGSSLDQDFSSGVNTGNPYNANPAGSIRLSPNTGTPIANYGFELVAVPEPTSMALLAVGAVGLVRRRRA